MIRGTLLAPGTGHRHRSMIVGLDHDQPQPAITKVTWTLSCSQGSSSMGAVHMLMSLLTSLWRKKDWRTG